VKNTLILIAIAIASFVGCETSTSPQTVDLSGLTLDSDPLEITDLVMRRVDVVIYPVQIEYTVREDKVTEASYFFNRPHESGVEFGYKLTIGEGNGTAVLASGEEFFCKEVIAVSFGGTIDAKDAIERATGVVKTEGETSYVAPNEITSMVFWHLMQNFENPEYVQPTYCIYVPNPTPDEADRMAGVVKAYSGDWEWYD
jgi:hypothetical protein